jgi:LysM repeat protein
VPRSGRPRAGNRRTAALRRWLVRVAAPAAFLLAATIAVLLVRSAVRGDEEAQPEPTTASRTATTQVRATTAQRQPRRSRATYTVREGDTLDEIALEHDTTVEELLALNPGVQPTELRPGQRLRVP